MGVKLGSLSEAPEARGAGQGGPGTGLEQGTSAPSVDWGSPGLGAEESQGHLSAREKVAGKSQGFQPVGTCEWGKSE